MFGQRNVSQHGRILPSVLVLLALLSIAAVGWYMTRNGGAGQGKTPQGQGKQHSSASGGAGSAGGQRQSGGAGATQQSGRRPAATVGTAQVEAADMPITVSAIGTVQPVVSATVRPQQAGVLSQLFFTEGEVVRKGQKLAEIDPRPYKLALAQAQANLARDEAQLNAAGVDLKRYKTLLAQDSIASQQVDTQAATVKQLDGTVAADRAALGTARLNLEYTTILAPVAGKAGLRQVDVGNYITPSDANGIVVITQSDPIDVSFALPQQQIGKLQQRAASSGDMPVTALDQSDGSCWRRENSSRWITR